MGSPMGFPPPPSLGGGAGFRMPSRGGTTGGTCPTCGMPMQGGGAQLGGDGQTGQLGQTGQPDAAWAARQQRRGTAGGNMPQPLQRPQMPPMPKPGGMPFPVTPRPGVTDMRGQAAPAASASPFEGAFRNFGG